MSTEVYNSDIFSMLAKTMKKRDGTGDKDQKQQEDQNKLDLQTCLGAREIVLLIREFNPTKNQNLTASEWIKEIENLGSIHKWSPYHLLLYASMRLAGVAKIWYEYSLESISNWYDFKKGLISNFPRSTDTASIHSKLIEKKRGSYEMLEEYFHCTVQLAKRIKLDDDSIKDYLIRGLDDSRQQLILSSIGSCTLSEFLQHMQRLEIESKTASRQLRQEDSHKILMHSPAKRQRSPEKFTRDDRNSFAPPPDKKERVRKCFICKSEDHMVYDCPSNPKNPDNTLHISPETQSRSTPEERSNSPSERKKKRTCYICKSRDHIAINCPKHRKNLAATKSENQSETRSHSRSNPRLNSEREEKCWDCGTVHGRYESCPKLSSYSRTSNQKGVKTCHYCKQVGHFIADCQMKQKEAIEPSSGRYKEGLMREKDDYNKNDQDDFDLNDLDAADLVIDDEYEDDDI